MMKAKVVLSALFTGVLVSAGAAPVFSDNFDSYSNGNLVGQGAWLQTDAISTSPIQVNSGVVSLGTSGQDAYATFN